jgi:hypothetical protein
MAYETIGATTFWPQAYAPVTTSYFGNQTTVTDQSGVSRTLQTTE